LVQEEEALRRWWQLRKSIHSHPDEQVTFDAAAADTPMITKYHHQH